MDRYLNSLTLLPCTLENGVFVTNVKWRFKPHHINALDNVCFVSNKLVLHDPNKNEPIKIQLRLFKQPDSKNNIYQMEYWHDNGWQWYSFIDYSSLYKANECTVHLSNNIYYGSKTLVDDLRQYLATIHGEFFAFGGKTYSFQKCSKRNLLAFIDQEYNEDFIIECQGKKFKIKKIILQARSHVFYAMLSTNYYTEGRDNRMVINDCCSEIVKKMIEFFETDYVTNTRYCEVELYEIARKYMSDGFMEFIRHPFVGTLFVANYLERLKAVIKHDDKETEELMKAWCSKKFNIVSVNHLY